MPALADELSTLGIDNSWLDGEIIVLNESGGSNWTQRDQLTDKVCALQRQA